MTIRIGCAAGFWGDSQVAATQLVRRAELDYLVLDYLAEVTMALLARAGSASADAGYATDFITDVVKPLLTEMTAKRVRLVTNAGGVNVRACRDAVLKIAARCGASVTVAVVEGDDLLPRADELIDGLRKSAEPELPDTEDLLSLNAYLGATPIAQALAEGADIVITGRCVDSALVLGPLMHEFGWRNDDYPRLASGSLAGHVIECGAQATGGLFTDWREVPDWEDIGYPIVECEPDGSFVLTKPPNTGGRVTPATVAEQIVYEIADPSGYPLPDVICDLSQVQLEQVGEHRVRVHGAQGRCPSSRYKVSGTYYDGYRTTALAMLSGREAVAKAERVADAMLARVRRMVRDAGMADFRSSRVEVLGAESIYGPHARPRDVREVVVRLSVHHDKRRAVSMFAKEVASAGTSFAPGLCGMIGGRARPTPMLQLSSSFIEKATVPVSVVIGARTSEPAVGAGPAAAEPRAIRRIPSTPPSDPTPPVDSIPVPLIALAHGRSGDKGDDANIGIIARDPSYLPLLRAVLTPRAVAAYFAHLLRDGAEGEVERFEWPGLHGLNFVLHHALGGGGLSSLRYDAQGKGLAQVLLDFPVPVPPSWLAADGRLASFREG